MEEEERQRVKTLLMEEGPSQRKLVVVASVWTVSSLCGLARLSQLPSRQVKMPGHGQTMDRYEV